MRSCVRNQYSSSPDDVEPDLIVNYQRDVRVRAQRTLSIFSKSVYNSIRARGFCNVVEEDLKNGVDDCVMLDILSWRTRLVFKMDREIEVLEEDLAN